MMEGRRIGIRQLLEISLVELAVDGVLVAKRAPDMVEVVHGEEEKKISQAHAGIPSRRRANWF